jgi:Uma2 family endonuclease
MSDEAAVAELEITLPPTQDELPCDDGEPMETARHRQQMNLLIETLHSWLAQRPDGYAGGNMFIYFSLDQVRHQDFRGPDFFLVLGVDRKERKSWVVWEEGKGPDVVIELLSARTASFDKGRKKDIYQNQLRVSEYFWYDPFHPEDWAGFKLSDGIYEPLLLDEQGRLVSPLLQLALVRWYGVFQGVETTWLRWADENGRLLPTEGEAAQAETRQAEQRAEEARRQAEEAKRQAEEAKRQAEEAKRQAEGLKQRAEAAEAELVRLKALLAKPEV